VSFKTISGNGRKMKKAIITLILAAVVLTTPATAKYSGGTGEPNAPYQIADANDLLAFAADTNDHDKYIILIADINLADQNFTGPVISGFSGNFNGNNHTISNITTDDGYSSTELGFFGSISNAVIENLNLNNINAYSYGSNYLGGLADTSDNSTINNCSVTGSINTSAFYAGGLVGQNINGQINNCSFQGSVTNRYYAAGGLVGINRPDSNITNCFSNCYVEGRNRIGGLVGSNYGYISNCFATGDVNTLSDSINAGGFAAQNSGEILNSACIVNINCLDGINVAGGFVGINYSNYEYSNKWPGIIKNCYCQSTITANNALQIGGFAGNSGGDKNNPTDPSYASGKCVIEDCYSASTITLDDYTIDAGGFAGANFDSQISGCYWDRDILTPQITQSIAYDVNSTTENLLPLTTAQMKDKTSFVGWDFINVWDIGENQTYPFLRRYQAADLNHDGIVNIIDFAILAENWLK